MFSFVSKTPGREEFSFTNSGHRFFSSQPLSWEEHSDFVEQLERLGFNRDFKSNGSLYLWNADLKIEFITAEKGAGTDNAIKIRKLGLSAIPLRFVAFLLEDPITIIDDGIRIRVPNPTNFCLHKLIIASRRKKIDKSLKDLEQAVCTSVILDLRELKSAFKSLPKGWRQAIARTLENAQEKLPLLSEEISKLHLTLQKVEE